MRYCELLVCEAKLGCSKYTKTEAINAETWYIFHGFLWKWHNFYIGRYINTFTVDIMMLLVIDGEKVTSRRNLIRKEQHKLHLLRLLFFLPEKLITTSQNFMQFQGEIRLWESVMSYSLFHAVKVSGCGLSD